ncbi:Lathosterol oxidase [Galdieria sulphuraria]|nr:Lathosterol oxidase [Galdieria sulphuraria]
MDVLGVVARMNTVSEDFLVYWVNSHVLDPLLSTQTAPEAIPLWRRSLVTWFLVYFGSIFIYYFFGWIDYYFIFLRNEKRNMDEHLEFVCYVSVHNSYGSIGTIDNYIEGYSKVYHRVEDYGWFYLIISPFLFVFFSDTLIYFIHLGLHHRLVYKHLHKPHHSFIDTTPFAAFAFHPIDGFLQGVPYQLYVFCLPIHASLHLSYSSYSWCEWSRTSSCSSQDL